VLLFTQDYKWVPAFTWKLTSDETDFLGTENKGFIRANFGLKMTNGFSQVVKP
jgi:hypothetical protein